MLPFELLSWICQSFTNKDLLQLGLAWKYFLETYTPSFVPWTKERQRLKQVSACYTDLPQWYLCQFPEFLPSRYHTQKTVRGNHFGQLEAHRFTLSFFVALFDVCLLDWHSLVRVRRLWTSKFAFPQTVQLLECWLDTRTSQHRPSQWGRNVLALCMEWHVPRKSRIVTELSNLSCLLRETDWVAALKISVVSVGWENMQVLLNRSIAKITAALSHNNKSLKILLLSNMTLRTLTIAKEELAPLLRAPIGFLIFRRILLPPAQDLQDCFDSMQEYPSLSELSIRHVALTHDQLVVLANTLCGPTPLLLKTLELSHAGLRDEGAIVIAKMLQENRSLEDVHLQGNWIQDTGMDAFLEMLKKNTTLQWLNLRDNKIIEAESKLMLLATECGWAVEMQFHCGNEFLMVHFPEWNRSVHVPIPWIEEEFEEEEEVEEVERLSDAV